MKIELLKQVLLVALSGSIITTAVIQKIKTIITNKLVLKIGAILVSFIIGILFALSFSDLSIANAVWVGLICYVGADVIYQAFEDKIFKSFSTINGNTEFTETTEETENVIK